MSSVATPALATSAAILCSNFELSVTFDFVLAAVISTFLSIAAVCGLIRETAAGEEDVGFEGTGSDIVRKNFPVTTLPFGSNYRRGGGRRRRKPGVGGNEPRRPRGAVARHWKIALEKAVGRRSAPYD
jgi:hypothetical protein